MTTHPHSPKKLVVFFDGTWNREDQHRADGRSCPTNVAKLFEATLPDDPNGSPQIVHYVRGVGTRASQRLRGGGFGMGISENIMEGYRFLVSNYEPQDEIYIFGFSRGAYTARSLAGMIYNMGILKREKFYLVKEAYERYKDRSPEWHPKEKNAQAFRRQHTWGAETIRFLGVFDTVGAMGAPFGVVLGRLIDLLFGCSFHDTKLSSIVQSAYHALSIHERRLPFLPTPMTPNTQHTASNFEQRWFSGVHSNVGGGYPDTGLSDVALQWMAEKAKLQGLNLDLGRISNPPFKPNPRAPQNDSQSLLYRIPSILLVKLPASLGFMQLVPDKYKDTIPHLRWNGDYVRPIQ
ncbi:MAG: DUF2235 domain-containing protein [Syntrophobacteraceae bacterium]